MSGNIAPMIAGSTAVIAAAAAAKKKREEEEKMTKYNGDDLDGWEFKIVRANTRKFKDAEMVEKVRQEEARAGWELLEKFDDYRLRFKRRVEKRTMDTHLDIDPYRTQIASPYGMAIGVSIGLFIVLASIVFALGVKFGFDRVIIGGLTLPGIIIGLIIVFGFIFGIIALANRK